MSTGAGFSPEPSLAQEAYRRGLRRRYMVRLLVTYLLPLILLTVYFFLEYGAIVSESERLRLKALAQSQASTLDLFLSERRANLVNLVNDPRLSDPPDSHALQVYLQDLKRMSETFVDLGYFDSSGVQVAYAGPYPALEKRSYSAEPWYVHLRQGHDDFIITDIYLGLRQQLHFTIAVKRIAEGKIQVLRSTLDPGKLYQYIRSLEGSREISTSIINKEGMFQLVTEQLGKPSGTSSFAPPVEPRLGTESFRVGGSSTQYAYAWLRMADWALIAQWSDPASHGFLAGTRLRVLGISAAVILIMFYAIASRARELADSQQETDPGLERGWGRGRGWPSHSEAGCLDS
jgi:two-component system NtrC family sensor kinase